LRPNLKKKHFAPNFKKRHFAPNFQKKKDILRPNLKIYTFWAQIKKKYFCAQLSKKERDILRPTFKTLAFLSTSPLHKMRTLRCEVVVLPSSQTVVLYRYQRTSFIA